ncbi:MAG TPA: HAD family hydrolase [Terriglobia bacterium]|nr:HAD family hydrolase [Terriglobia bacterium]
MPASRIRAVFFDAGNTLIFPRLDELARELTAEGYPAAVADFHASERAGKLKLAEWLAPQIASGQIPRAVDPVYWKAYLAALAERIGVPEAEREAAMRRVGERFADILLWSEVPPTTPPFLDALRSQGYALAVISNSNGMIEAQLARVDLGRRFDFVIDSHHVGVEKPHPEIFRLALERAAVGAAEAVFVGDSYATDITGARAAGLHAVLFDPTGVYDHSLAGLGCPRITALPGLQDVLATL